ncbi:Na+/H+ antiporter family protein [Spongorhabdus nitratireducens]
MNAVVIAVGVMLVLSMMRLNVVLSLFLGALAGGLSGGLDMAATMNAFTDGLDGGASIAFSYALLGGFAMTLSRSGLPELLAGKIVAQVKDKGSDRKRTLTYALLGSIALMAVASQNLVPIHIAFIPLLIPPLLAVFSRLNIDRRAVACVITFGLTATYMLLPVGFGNIYLNEVLGSNLKNNGLNIEAINLSSAMAIPVAGMFLGLLVAVFFTYRKPREYRVEESLSIHPEDQPKTSPARAIVMLLAIAATLVGQLQFGSMALGALAGCVVLMAGGIVNWKEADNVFIDGMKMMAFCGFIMISASGFAEVVRTTGAVPELVSSIQALVGDNKAITALMMLLVGLFITMGIGSSFSTVPIIATLYVPLALQLGFSPLAVACLVGTAGALGDAGSPASDSTIGPTAGLNADGQHDHMRDTVIPTFIHYNIPLVLFGWLAAMVL